MPHQCVHCGKIYPTACKELLEGCNCGSRFFFFVREDNLKQLQEKTENLTVEDKQEIEQEVREIIGVDFEDRPIILDFESVRMLSPGKFEIDLVSLFKKKPVIYKVGEGKYIIDLPSTFKFAEEEWLKKSSKNKKKSKK
jgi:predicted  nucleic acid-binding Zn-ribbon protein